MQELLNSEQLSRTLKRMTHEIIERNSDLDAIVFVGVLKKGTPIASALKKNLALFAQIDAPLYALDISPFRDDISLHKVTIDHLMDIKNKIVILVDDVLFTGRSVRAAMDALIRHGRPKEIQLAILIDRGHRELPIRANYIGKNIPTRKEDFVFVDMEKATVSLKSSQE